MNPKLIDEKNKWGKHKKQKLNKNYWRIKEKKEKGSGKMT